MFDVGLGWRRCVQRTKKPAARPAFFKNIGRGDMIRTCDFYVPNVIQQPFQSVSYDVSH